VERDVKWDVIELKERQNYFLNQYMRVGIYLMKLDMKRVVGRFIEL
jgi:hypothetical protein